MSSSVLPVWSDVSQHVAASLRGVLSSLCMVYVWVPGALTSALLPLSACLCVAQTLTTAPVQPPRARWTPAPITTRTRAPSAGGSPPPARRTSPSASADETPHRWEHTMTLIHTNTLWIYDFNEVIRMNYFGSSRLVFHHFLILNDPSNLLKGQFTTKS